MVKTFLTGLLAGLMVAAPLSIAVAADLAPGPQRKPSSLAPSPGTLRAGALKDLAATCREWTDGCRICLREHGEFNCSTPGIACLPQAGRCTR